MPSLTLNLTLGLAIVAIVFLFLAGILVLALGARAWSDAVAAQHRARAHSYEADATRETIGIAEEALTQGSRIQHPQEFHTPSDEELLAAMRAEREYTTEGNEGFDPVEPIPSGGFYR